MISDLPKWLRLQLRPTVKILFAAIRTSQFCHLCVTAIFCVMTQNCKFMCLHAEWLFPPNNVNRFQADTSHSDRTWRAFLCSCSAYSLSFINIHKQLKEMRIISVHVLCRRCHARLVNWGDNLKRGICGICSDYSCFESLWNQFYTQCFGV